ncbi:MAG: RluA family pseudouridine synthase, partial [Lachnospiraceae bacterium]|nr:RluA family pseudouridine synthase [Lachnospiraceae bacterium]
ARVKRTDRSICINGIPVLTSALLGEGDLLTVTLVEKPEGRYHAEPAPIPVSILWEDEDLLVINKDANMPVHPSAGNHANTLAHALAFWAAQRGEEYPCRCINRLDRDTTGLLIVCKNALSSCILSEDMKKRQIQRTYLAIVKGNAGDGSVEAPIARREGSAIMRCVDHARGEYALTHYQTLSYRADLDLSLLRIRLETGRTHQIRVHMNYIGHPLIGDFLYGTDAALIDRQDADFPHKPDTALIGRQALHSMELRFVHPLSGEQMHFLQPLPQDMQSLFPMFDVNWLSG